MPVGNVNSTERGSGARYNDGKPDLSLIPPSLLCADGATHYALLRALDNFMFKGDSSLLVDWHYDQMRTHSGTCAKVFEYGKRKYAARGECTCPGGDKAKRRRAEVLAETNMKSTSENLIQSTQSDSEQTAGRGTLGMPLVYDSGKRPEERKPEQSQKTKTALSTEGSRECTVSPESSTTRCLVLGVKSAEVATDYTLTTATRPEELGEYFAIPATSALDFSKGLTAGLNEHSPTCGVHKVTGGAWNWAKGMNWSIPVACALRHADAYYVGNEELDPESGLPHIGHILCNTTMLLYYLTNYEEGNDLPYKVLVKGVNN